MLKFHRFHYSDYVLFIEYFLHIAWICLTWERQRRHISQGKLLSKYANFVLTHFSKFPKVKTFQDFARFVFGMSIEWNFPKEIETQGSIEDDVVIKVFDKDEKKIDNLENRKSF